jgi:Xaa-Pro aminopeptidase
MRSTPSWPTATCCNTAPSAMAIPSACCRITTGARPGSELREDIDTVLEPGMVISMEPMLTIPEGRPGAGGYREHDILIITEDGAENITGYPYGPEFNQVG